MAVSAISAARTLCELRGWSLSNLELQKILYVAQMFHLGKYRAPLILEEFEAWDFGPVVPSLYQHVRGFGRSKIGNIFNWVMPVQPGSIEYESLREAAEATRRLSASQLVEFTHRPGGAWADVYRPGSRGVRINNQSILREYVERTARPTAAAG